jgi:hypothetical protein
MATLGLAACESATEPNVMSEVLDEMAANTTVDGRSVERGGLSEFDELARLIPGFAGYWFDRGCNLNVNLVDLASADRVKELLAPVLRRYLDSARRCPREATILIHQVRFSWVQLTEYVKKVRPVGTIGGVVGIGIDVPANRVAISVTSREAAMHVIEALQRLDVPSELVIFKLVDAPTGGGRSG